MTDFKVTKSGWYRTRDGRYAEVLFNKHIDYVPGFFENSTIMNQWDRNGRHAFPTTPVTDPDLIEYLGKERPKQKKIVRMAPALFRLESTRFGTSTWLYQSEERAREAQGDSFVRWLIDTPYAVEVEVPDNG